MTTTAPAKTWIIGSALARSVRRISATGANLLITARNAMSAFAVIVRMEHTVTGASKARFVISALRKRHSALLGGTGFTATSAFIVMAAMVAAMAVMVATKSHICGASAIATFMF